jgi:hypothetical protein
VQWRKLKDNSEADGLHPSQVKIEEKTFFRAWRIPTAHDGLRKDDTIAMILGGSGDYLAGALARRGLQIGARVYRVPPFHLMQLRGDRDKEQDAWTLAHGFQTQPDLFYQIAGDQDLELIYMRECYRERMDCMKARIACEQRLFQRFSGERFHEELYPEGAIKDAFDRRKANDPVLQNLIEEEKRAEAKLVRTLENLALYRELFKPVRGLGPMASARILAAIIDFRRFIVEPNAERMNSLYEESKRLEEEVGVNRTIRRWLDDGKISSDSIASESKRFMVLGMVAKEYFSLGLSEDGLKVNRILALHHERAQLRHQAKQKTAAKLKKFLGVHVLPDGSFARRRHGEVANWHPDGRQGLFLLGSEQFGMYQAKSEWGMYLKLMKLHFREVHPEVVEVGGKKRYTNGHIHNMAIWRTLTRFVEQMTYAYLEFEQKGKTRGIRPPNTHPDGLEEVA